MKIKVKPKLSNFSFSEKPVSEEKRTMSDEHKAAMLRGRQLLTEERETNAESAIVIGSYRIRRLDDYNPCTVEKKRIKEDKTTTWDLVGYFSAIDVALMCIFRASSIEKTKSAAKELFDAFKESEFKILDAIKKQGIHLEAMDKWASSKWLAKDRLFSEKNKIEEAIEKLNLKKDKNKVPATGAYD